MQGKGKYILDSNEIRIYKRDEACVFKKNNEKYGGLSNMSTEFPLVINDIKIKTTEALYQACRFPHIPELQERIINQSSPMHVKMISNANKLRSRNDWDNVRLKIMRWCISVKLAQNFVAFGAALNETGLKYIVENSSSDNFWGAILNDDDTYIGKNALGRLLMELRQTFYSVERYSLLFVDLPKVDNFLLFGKEISIVDERENFIQVLKKIWRENNGIQGKLFSEF